MRDITTTGEWEIIKEAMRLIERFQEPNVQLEQLYLISKYTDELKKVVRYGIEQTSPCRGCGQ